MDNQNKPTIEQKSQFSRSIGSGVKSLMAGGRKYYILEHRTESAGHKAGKVQEIIVDYIELGRDSKCQVRFGDDMPTVSRRHAAIVVEDNRWMIKHLSVNNQTLVNGRPVAKQWYLENGDEIQLSAEGPKMGFIVPPNNTTGSLGFTKRMSLFRQQALRPYKRAIAFMSIFFILAVGALSFVIYNQGKSILEQQEELIKMAENAEVFQGDVDSLRNAIAQNEDSRESLRREVERLKRISQEQQPQPQAPETGTIGNYTRPDSSLALDGFFGSVYYMSVYKIEVTVDGVVETIEHRTSSGTGFLTTNNYFITARHVIENWYFLNDDDAFKVSLNKIVNKGGKVVAYINAYSSTGPTLHLKTTDFTVDRSRDVTMVGTDPSDGSAYTLTRTTIDKDDWAYFKTSYTGTIEIDPLLSKNLRQQDKLHVLGFPRGLGGNPSNVTPIYGNGIVSANGLSDGMILVTDRNWEKGNSGGPAFIVKDSKYYAVGIVVGSMRETHSVGYITPLSALGI